MIQRNRHPAGRLSNMVFGLCAVGDGLVRILSFGFAHSTLTLDWSNRQARLGIQQSIEEKRHDC